jgi:peroxiredoxin
VIGKDGRKVKRIDGELSYEEMDRVIAAPDFTLSGLDGGSVRFSAELKEGFVVLILLRGWPGYQCPFCTRQFGDFLRYAKARQDAGAKMIFVYPGSAENLQRHAEDFRANRKLPENFKFAIPDYAFTNAYGLRWDAKNETAYPAALVIDRSGTVRFALISHEHGGRDPATDILKALAAIGM